jgi:hypothetical protein
MRLRLLNRLNVLFIHRYHQVKATKIVRTKLPSTVPLAIKAVAPQGIPRLNVGLLTDVPITCSTRFYDEAQGKRGRSPLY